MKRWILILTLTLLVSLNSVGYAGEFGTNGLITMPTADLLVESHLDLSYQHTFGDQSDDLINLNYGLKPGVQVGTRAAWYNDGDEFQLEPNLKFNLAAEKGDYQPLLAVGVSGWEDNLYLAASKMISIYGLRLHLGAGDEGVFPDYFGIGVSKILNPVVISTDSSGFQMPRTTIQAEYNDTLNLGSEFRFGSGIEINLGLIDFKDIKLGIGFENRF